MYKDIKLFLESSHRFRGCPFQCILLFHLNVPENLECLDVSCDLWEVVSPQRACPGSGVCHKGQNRMSH